MCACQEVKQLIKLFGSGHDNLPSCGDGWRIFRVCDVDWVAAINFNGNCVNIRWNINVIKI